MSPFFFELELLGSSPDEPKPMKNTIELASSLSFSFIKKWKLRARACSELFEKPGLSSLELIYCEPKIRPGPSSPSPGSFPLYLGPFPDISLGARPCVGVFEKLACPTDS